PVDLRNTPASYQLVAREQMLKFLQALPPGQRGALFTLTDRLRMIQSYSGSPALLAAAGKMLNPKDFGRMPSKDQVDRDVAIADEFARQSGNNHSAMQHSVQTQDTDLETRATTSISARAALARDRSGYP